MSMRREPPGRTSSWQTGAVKCSGGNHSANCRGSVHAWYTSSRGASNTRVVVSVRSAGGVTVLLVPLFMRLVLPLQLSQVVFQAIEALLPELAVTLHPVGGFLETLRPEPARPPLRVATPRDEAGTLQHLQVLGDGWKRHVERLRELRDRGLALREAGEDRPPRRISESPKCDAQVVCGHLYIAPSG